MQGENLLGSLSDDNSNKSIRKKIKYRGREFFGIEETEGREREYAEDLAIRQRMDEMSKSIHELISAQENLKNMISDHTNTITEFKSRFQERIDNLSKNIVGDMGDFNRAYNNDKVLVVDKSKTIKVGLAKESFGDEPDQSGMDDRYKAGGGGGGTTPTSPNQSGVTNTSQTRRMSLGPLGIINGSILNRKDKPRTISLSDDDGDGEKQTFTIDRHPFKHSFKRLADGETIMGMFGIMGRRFDTLNQMIGGLETKIPPADQIQAMKDQLQNFMGVYGLASQYVGSSKSNPFQSWMSDLEDIRGNKSIILDVSERWNGIKKDIQVLRGDVADLKGIRAQIATITNREIGEYFAEFDFENIDIDLKGRFKTLVSDTSISTLGITSSVLPKDSQGNPMSIIEYIANNFKLANGGYLKSINFGGNIKKLKDTVTSLDDHLISIKKKFNSIRSTVRGVRSKLSSRVNLSGFGSAGNMSNPTASMTSLGLGGRIAKVMNMFKTLMDKRKVKVGVYWRELDSGVGKAQIYFSVAVRGGDESLPDKVYHDGYGDILKNVNTYNYSSLVRAMANINKMQKDLVADADADSSIDSSWGRADILGFYPLASKQLILYAINKIKDIIKDKVEAATDGTIFESLNLLDRDITGKLSDNVLPNKLSISSKLPSGWNSVFASQIQKLSLSNNRPRTSILERIMG